MKLLHSAIATFTALSLCSAFGAETLDSQMSTLAQTLAAKIKDSGKKKVTVLDFTDLEGKKVTELGRYVAEQLTVNLDSSKKEFTLVDRANLKRILDEHKLTVSGLVDPENAKKLGQISGVDALILGTIADLPNSVKVFAKIIATDTADLAGGGECRVTKDDEVKYLLGRGIESGGDETTESGNGATSGGNPSASKAGQQKTGNSNLDLIKLVQVEKNSTHVGDLFIRVESVRQMREQGRDYLSATLALVNTNTTVPMLASIRFGGRYYSTLTDKQGKVFATPAGQADIIGIGTGDQYNNQYFGNEFTEIEPGSSIKVTIRHGMDDGGGGYIVSGENRTKNAVAPPYRLQFTIAIGADLRNGELVNGKKRSVLIEVETDK